MNRIDIAVQTIKDTISAQDVGQAIGLEIRHGRCQCPMHGGHDFNCVLYKGNRGFYCHVCKQGGDVIRFAQRYYNMSFKDTVAWFNGTFGLGMDIDSPMSPEASKQAEFAQTRRAMERETAELTARLQYGLYLTAEDIISRLEIIRDDKRPRTYADRWDPDFCAAVETLPEAKRFADECMMNCIEVKE